MKHLVRLLSRFYPSQHINGYDWLYKVQWLLRQSLSKYQKIKWFWCDLYSTKNLFNSFPIFQKDTCMLCQRDERMPKMPPSSLQQLWRTMSLEISNVFKKEFGNSCLRDITENFVFIYFTHSQSPRKLPFIDYVNLNILK